MVLTGEADYRTPIVRLRAVLPGAEAAQGGHRDGAYSRGLHGMTARPSNLIAKVDNILAWFGKYRKK